ncbi:MAG: Asp-tRNA(Asn)/Glu-tRNA(Gln) amidotransferase subunit GatC [Eubacterium sp.]|nr:Asp-tRNA(Asn)/Glu-tRNA(Gln) amidotransferase subunit GatC [Eubacterium sp.]
MVEINDEILDRVGILAKLELSPDERQEAARDMDRIIKYFQKLEELDTEEVEPLTHIQPIQNVFRQDLVRSGDREEILKNAPLRTEDAFVVPKTFQ